MRIESIVSLLVCLCLWIPAAQSYSSSATPPEDEDASGDDLEISGSGSGDEGSVVPIDLMTTEVSTLAITNTTKTAWVTDAPVKVPEPTASQLSSTVIPLADVETAGPTTKAPLLHTTKIPETSPSPSSVESLTHMKDVSGAETPIVHHVNLEDNTTLPDEKLPVVPVTTEHSITTPPVDVEEETTVLVALDKEEDRATDPVVVVDQSTDAPDMESTILPLTTTSAKEVADPEASGETVESTTVQATIDGGLIEENVIPGVNREAYTQMPGSDDFHFENEIRPNSRANRPESEVSLGASSEDGSLLERTEVLAGVIAGGLVGLAFAIMLVALMVYRMKKKDEGSYSLDEHKHPNGGYQRPMAQEEFLA
ncbi:syndecan-1 isoform X2 [Pygocentrus nattereri]|uniref:syndecan-1 isoform X2 n=1 Tax=Pygocentrus nattereri TaxID=42514 RepID=UPI000814B463|nr:syndecan-1 isoform X2 [Pygocentrus nattereri]